MARFLVIERKDPLTGIIDKSEAYREAISREGKSVKVIPVIDMAHAGRRSIDTFKVEEREDYEVRRGNNSRDRLYELHSINGNPQLPLELCGITPKTYFSRVKESGEWKGMEGM